MRNFITDMGEGIILSPLESGVDEICVPRYGVWCHDKAKGKNQVFETSDDLEYLKSKYEVKGEPIRIRGIK